MSKSCDVSVCICCFCLSLTVASLSLLVPSFQILTELSIPPFPSTFHETHEIHTRFLTTHSRYTSVFSPETIPLHSSRRYSLTSSIPHTDRILRQQHQTEIIESGECQTRGSGVTICQGTGNLTGRILLFSTTGRRLT